VTLFIRSLLVVGVFAGLVLAGIGGAALVGSGEWHLWAVPVLGLSLSVVGVLVLIDLAPFRGAPGPAVAVDGGIRLPLRPGVVGRHVAVATLAGSWGLLGAVIADGAVAVSVGSLWALACLAYAASSWHAGAARFSITLDPEGATLPRGLGNPRVAWRDVREVEVSGGFQPVLALHLDGGGVSGTALRPQAWSADDLTALARKAARSTSFRSRLSDPAAVDRVRADLH